MFLALGSSLSSKLMELDEVPVLELELSFHLNDCTFCGKAGAGITG
jgi:hypothetical protein